MNALALECRAKSVSLCRVPSPPRFVVGQSRARSHFAAAFASAVAWALLWTLLLSAAFAPPEGAEVEASDATGYRSAEIDPPMLAMPGDRTGWPPSLEADWCGGAMIEIDGSCVFGEELEVRPPAGWSRR